MHDEDEQKTQLVRFLAERLDQKSLRDPPPEQAEWLDENFWARLADGLVGPEELARLEPLLSDPRVRRRVSASVRQWPPEWPAVVPEATSPDRVIVRLLWWRQWRLAAAAVVLVAATLAVSAWVWWRAEPAVDTLLARAADLVAQEHHDQARALLDRVLAREDLLVAQRNEARRLYGQSCLERASRLVQEGLYPAALAEAEQAIRFGVANVRVYLIRATAALGHPVQLAQVDLDVVTPQVKDVPADMPAEARLLADIYQEAKTALPREAFAYRELAVLYAAHGQYALAALNAQEWLRVEPASVSAANLLGLIRFRQKLHEEALKAFQQGLEAAREPQEKAVLHFNLAETCLDSPTDRLSEALAHYKEFVALAPDHPAARRARERIADLEQVGVPSATRPKP